MKIQYLREFLEISKHLSFSKAAKELFISEPPLSRHMVLLEKELGVQLLDRSTHHVNLTTVGKELLPCIDSIVKNYDALLLKSALYQKGISNSANIGLLIHGRNEYLDDLFNYLREYLPFLMLRINYLHPKPLFDAINNNIVDIGILPLSDYPLLQNLQIIPFTKVGYNAVVPFGHPLYDKEVLTLDDLKDEKYVFVSEDPLVSYAHHQSLAKCGIFPKEEISSLNFDTVPSTVIETGYISIQSDAINCLPYPKVKYIPIDAEKLYFEVGFCYLKENNTSMIALLSDIIRQFASHF